MAKNVIFVGCGKVATPAATSLLQQGIQVHGVKRDATTLPDFMEKSSADVADPASLGFLKHSDADTIVYSLAAGGFDEASYTKAYITGLKNTVSALNPDRVKRLIFVSSTAVYHQQDASIVDENSATRPQRFNGRIMLDAEKIALDTRIGTALRFSGIYGPGRNRLIERVKTGNCTPENSASYTNRIHTQDCSAALAHLIMQPELPPVIIGSDSEPAKSTDVESFIARQLGVQKQYADSTSTVRRIAGSKQCCNRLLLDTGFVFSYPGYKDGYKELVKNYGAKKQK